MTRPKQESTDELIENRSVGLQLLCDLTGVGADVKPWRNRISSFYSVNSTVSEGTLDGNGSRASRELSKASDGEQVSCIVKYISISKSLLD